VSTSTSFPSSDQPRPAEPPVPGAGEVYVLPAGDIRVLDTVEAGGRRRGSEQRVTSARGSHSDDVARRMRTYAISMGIRTLCVLAAVLSFPHWYAWLFVPGAVVLPYVAVVLANAGGERVPTGPAAVTPVQLPLPVLRTSGTA